MKPVSVQDAVELVPDGATLMIGGFMAVGTPERLIDELIRQGKRNLTIVANDTAKPGLGIGKLVDAGLVSRTIASYIGVNPETQRQMIAGKMAVDLIPQGTLIERIRAGGCGLVVQTDTDRHRHHCRRRQANSRGQRKKVSERRRHCEPTLLSSMPSWPTTSAIYPTPSPHEISIR